MLGERKRRERASRPREEPRNKSRSKRAPGQSSRVLWEREAWEKGSKGLERFR